MPRVKLCAICGAKADFDVMFFHKGVCAECVLARQLTATGLLINLQRKSQQDKERN
jgi:hypothetical protein